MSGPAMLATVILAAMLAVPLVMYGRSYWLSP